MKIVAKSLTALSVFTASLMAALPASADSFTLNCTRDSMNQGQIPSRENAERLMWPQANFIVQDASVTTTSPSNGRTVSGDVLMNDGRYDLIFELEANGNHIRISTLYIPNTGVYVQRVIANRQYEVGSARGTCNRS